MTLKYSSPMCCYCWLSLILNFPMMFVIIGTSSSSTYSEVVGEVAARTVVEPPLVGVENQVVVKKVSATATAATTTTTTTSSRRQLEPKSTNSIIDCVEGDSPLLCHNMLPERCSNTSFAGCGVVCDNYIGGNGQQQTCDSSTFQDGSVDCKDGACFNSSFTNMDTVDCRSFHTTDRTCRSSTFVNTQNVNCEKYCCNDSVFHESRVNCRSTSSRNTHSCRSSDFFNSAVYCTYTPFLYPETADCYGSYFNPCSCCDGDACPTGVSSCTEEFCFSTYLGDTCKEWGNPYCEEVDLSPSFSPATATISPSSLRPPPTILPTTTSDDPTIVPTTISPTGQPTIETSFAPTMYPTDDPSPAPTSSRPTTSPSNNPTTMSPTVDATIGFPPTNNPTTKSPTVDVIIGFPQQPTNNPTTMSPTTDSPTKSPPMDALLISTGSPSSIPSIAPSLSRLVTAAETTQIDTSVEIILTPEDIFGTTDAELDDGSIKIIEEPTNGDVTITSQDGNLRFDYTPDDGFEGKDDVTISLCDVNGVCVPLRMEFTVEAEEKGREGLYALLSLLLAPILWLFQEPLKRLYDNCFPAKETIPKNTGRGDRTATTGSTSGGGIPASIGCIIDQTSFASETSIPAGNDEFEDDDDDDDESSTSSDDAEESSSSSDYEDFTSNDDDDDEEDDSDDDESSDDSTN